MSKVIEVENLTKIFKFSAKKPERGFWKNFFAPEKKMITAVDHISFSVQQGESVAFIGPNGAGKSTTIKMLTGILYPTSGAARVLGFDPQKQRRQLSYKIGTVFGQRSQLVFNLPVRDSFHLFGKIYELGDAKIRRREKELLELFDITDLADQPVRKLSLGQRMRAEVALALIHEPEIIFLDEPTIGLDIVAKRKLRQTLLRLNQSRGTTIFLTSHDPGDIETLSGRTMVINYGKIILDELTDDLRQNYFTHKRIKIDLQDEQAFKLDAAESVKQEGNIVQLKIDTKHHSLNQTLKEILEQYAVDDIDVGNAPLEEIIEHIYEKSRRAHQSL